jgi:hypothetical protein
MNEHVGQINQLTDNQRRQEKPRVIREGFVDPEKNKPEPEVAKPPAPHPGPELESSPADLPADDVAWPMIVKLSFKPIKNNKNETINELSFREPRGGDINRYGNPARMNNVGEWIIEERKMHYIMAALSDVLPPLLDAMDPRDWNVCAYELMRFFLPTRRV